ncbi:MAG TPA: hypothetical protein DFH98_02330, partial [Psychrobacter sp.]|nr:hypothetical protein [Psychrobacter sp.]
MKKAHQTLTLRLSSMMKNHLLLTSTLLSGALLLTGCQSANLNQSNALTVKQSPSTAKKTLATALQKQRR